MTRYAGVPVNSPDGGVIGTLCILDDRSDEVLDDEDLHFLRVLAMRISSELEREAQLAGLQRDLATAQSQLIQNEKLAITGTLAAAIAHDIRNIVSALSLDLGEEDNLEAVKTHVDRFNVLAHRLLSYAQPSNSCYHPVALRDVLERVSTLLARHFDVMGIRFELWIASDLPDINADPARIEHLFVNLCMNAIQAMSDEGEIQIRAFTEGGRTVVEVQDNGPGIAPEIAADIFKPFVSSRTGGFGLGLYSCRQIVQECGGTIQLTSESGQGSTFRMEFPN